jgi:hypothetical protein
MGQELHCFAAIIFATYYQSVFVGLSSRGNHPTLTTDQALKWNDEILCIEMIVFAASLFLAFPAKGMSEMNYVLPAYILIC